MRKVFRRLRFVFQVRKSIPFLLEFFKSSQVSTGKKLFSILLVVGYMFFPFDIIPDFLVFFGIVDDVTVLTLVLQQIVKMAPLSLKEKYGVME